MQSNRYTCFILSLSILMLLLSSCGQDKEASYRYKIENTTVNSVEVVVEVKQNPGVTVHGDGKFYYTVAPGETAAVWSTSGYTTDEVWDEERTEAELHWISVTATSNGRPARYNLSRTSRWGYEKKDSHQATYTLTLTEDDFL